MNADGGIKLSLRRSTLHRHGEALNDLAGVRPHHMNTQHAIRSTIDDQLHEGLFVATRQRLLQRRKGRLVDIDGVKFGARLFLRQSATRLVTSPTA